VFAPLVAITALVAVVVLFLFVVLFDGRGGLYDGGGSDGRGGLYDGGGSGDSSRRPIVGL
jgi:hypothetical protein